MSAAGAHHYAAGQLWRYRVRPGDEGSLLQINQIDQDPRLGGIFHISVFDVHLPADPGAAARGGGAMLTSIPHLPVSRATLEQSVLELTSAAPREADYAEGHAIWREAFEAGEAGIYTLSVADIVSGIAQMLGGSGRA